MRRCERMSEVQGTPPHVGTRTGKRRARGGSLGRTLAVAPAAHAFPTWRVPLFFSALGFSDYVRSDKSLRAAFSSAG